jgi:zinc transport system ATP-binding protein
MGESSEVPAFRLHDVWLRRDGQPVLEGIDLTVPQHDYLGILGPNGGGKTTLVQLMLGLLKPDRGTIEVFGETPRKARGRLAYVPQYFDFDRQFPVQAEEVVRMGRLHRKPLGRPYSSRDRERAREAMCRLHVEDLATRPIGALSGGQLQRVLIARALAGDAKAIILDEPTAHLDAKSAGLLYELLQEMNRTITILLIGHDVGVMNRHVKNVACVNRSLFHGHIRELTQEVMERIYGHDVDLIGHHHHEDGRSC